MSETLPYICTGMFDAIQDAVFSLLPPVVASLCLLQPLVNAKAQPGICVQSNFQKWLPKKKLLDLKKIEIFINFGSMQRI